MANSNYIDVDSVVKTWTDKQTATDQKKKDEISKQGEEAIAEAEKNTTDQIEQTTDDYLDVMRSAGIQKELDLRDIRETRANMGLSRSGLSSTEQTAAILSAGNKVGAAQVARQKAIDTLNQSLLDYTNEINAGVRSKHLEIDTETETNAASLRTELEQKNAELLSEDHQAEVKAEADKYSAYITAQENEATNRKKDLSALLEIKAISDTTYGVALVTGVSAEDAYEAEKLLPTYQKITADASGTAQEKQATQLNNDYLNGKISQDMYSLILNLLGIDYNGNVKY